MVPGFGFRWSEFPPTGDQGRVHVAVVTQNIQYCMVMLKNKLMWWRQCLFRGNVGGDLTRL